MVKLITKKSLTMAERRSSRRKSGLGGLDDEEKIIKNLVERSKRRKSESGTKDLLEHRRIMKELEVDEGEENVPDEEEEDEEEEAEAEEPEKDLEEGSDDDDNDSSSDDGDSDVDEEEKLALDAAMKAILAADSLSSSKTKTKRRRQRNGLNTKADPSPYLSKQNGVIEVRNKSLVDRRKGSSIDIETLANQSEIYGKSKSSNNGGGIEKKSNIVTSGAGWFNLPATEMTEELKQDLRAVRMRSALDPKRFYKALDRPSKFVQIGTIIEGRDEYYSSRLTRKQRRTNLVDELMADEKTRQYTKRKFSSIQNDKQNKKRFGPKKKNTKNFGLKSKKA